MTGLSALDAASAGLVPLAVESSAPAMGPVRTALVVLLTLVGAAFLPVGTVGLLRLPSIYNRMHATSKATTLGAASVALAGVARFGPGGEGLTALVTVLFLFLTAPTGAHMISRAAQRMGVPFEEGVEWPASPDESAEIDPESDD